MRKMEKIFFMQNTTTLPDNLKARLSRVYVDARSFKDDLGKDVKYDRFVVEILVKDEPVNIEFKIDKKDKMLLQLADQIDGQKTF